MWCTKRVSVPFSCNPWTSICSWIFWFCPICSTDRYVGPLSCPVRCHGVSVLVRHTADKRAPAHPFYVQMCICASDNWNAPSCHCSKADWFIIHSTTTQMQRPRTKLKRKEKKRKNANTEISQNRNAPYHDNKKTQKGTRKNSRLCCVEVRPWIEMLQQIAHNDRPWMQRLRACIQYGIQQQQLNNKKKKLLHSPKYKLTSIATHW